MYNIFVNKVFTLNNKALVICHFSSIIIENPLLWWLFHIGDYHIYPIKGLTRYSVRELKIL